MVHLFGTTFWKELKKTPDGTAYLPPTEARQRDAIAKIMQRFRENNQETADSSIDSEILDDVERLKDYLFRTRFPDVGEEIHKRLVGSPRTLFLPTIRAGATRAAGATAGVVVGDTNDTDNDNGNDNDTDKHSTDILVTSSRSPRRNSMTDSARPTKKLRYTPTFPDQVLPPANISDYTSGIVMPAVLPDWPPTSELESTVADMDIAQDVDPMSPSAIAGVLPKTASFDSIEWSNEVHPVDPHGFSKDDKFLTSIHMNEEPAATGGLKTIGLDDSAQLCDLPVDNEWSEFVGDLFDDDNKNTAPAATGGLKTTGLDNPAQFCDLLVDNELSKCVDFFFDDDN